MLETQSDYLAWMSDIPAKEEYHADNKLLTEWLLGYLDETEREVIELLYFKGFTIREIAKEMYFSKSKVSRIHSRAIAKMREIAIGAVRWDYIPSGMLVSEDPNKERDSYLSEYLQKEPIVLFRHGKYWMVTEEGKLVGTEKPEEKEEVIPLPQEGWDELIAVYGVEEAAEVALFHDRPKVQQGTHHGYLSELQLERRQDRETQIFESRGDENNA